MDQPPKKSSKHSRRYNRVMAAQFLYMWSLNPSASVTDSLVDCLDVLELKRKEYAFAESLIQGAVLHLEAIDTVIQQYAQNWTMGRIDKVDLAILRLALFELLYRKDIPPIVTINEAIELCKCLSHDDSRRFVNGILDKFKETLDRPLRTSNSV